MSLKFKFDLNSNWFVIYKTVLEKKKDFLVSQGFWAEFPARPPPAHMAYVAQPPSTVAQRSVGTHPHSEAESDPLSEFDPIAPNLTR
jgi:hypothetical protein